MVTKPKSNSVITHALDGDNITFIVAGAGNVVLDLSKVHVAVHTKAAIHGFIQRISDRAAIGRDAETGLSATPLEKLNAMRELVEHYQTGSAEWSVRSSAPRSEGGLLFTCLREVYAEKSEIELREFIKPLTSGQKNALLNSPKLKEVADRIRLEATKLVDADALLSGLE